MNEVGTLFINVSTFF